MSAPRIPNSEIYWKNKGKIGKSVMIYFHDDLDGIYSAIVMKKYLIEKGFKIHGYGIVNYQEGWTTTELDLKYINIALDFAENTEGIDIYIDHHNTDLEKFKEAEKNNNSVKTETTSAYEGICDQLGLPIDSMIQNVIDMVDSARYEHYKIKPSIILNFDFNNFKSKLDFAAAFNQTIKRSDHKTFIEVVANINDYAPSVYNIYRLFKLFYPANNLNIWKIKKMANNVGMNTDEYINHIIKVNTPLYKSFQRDYLEDAKWRLGEMLIRTRGSDKKFLIHSQDEFIEKFKTSYGFTLNGYQIIGNIVYIPPGTWANAIRGRAIFEIDSSNIYNIEDEKRIVEKIQTISYFIKENKHFNTLKNCVGDSIEVLGEITYDNGVDYIDIKDISLDGTKIGIKGIIDMDSQNNLIFRAKPPILWIMLQYGNTLQLAAYHNLDNYDEDYLPKLKNGQIIGNLGKYHETLLDNFVSMFDYKIDIYENAITVAGGHKGIGTISNINGYSVKFKDTKFINIFKNKIIQDLSGINWPYLRMDWSDKETDTQSKRREIIMNNRIMFSKDIRKESDVI